jgi:hypothetical protein
MENHTCDICNHPIKEKTYYLTIEEVTNKAQEMSECIANPQEYLKKKQETMESFEICETCKIDY